MMKVTEKMAGRCRDFRAYRPAVIVCLGDSVTHGCFEMTTLPNGGWETTFRPHEGYAARLQKKLNALYPAAAPCVMDAGISGDSAKGGLDRLERDVLSLKPDLVIVNFGLNDSGNEDVEGGLKAYAANMAAIFDKVLATGAECMLLTPNRMCAYVPAGIHKEELRAIAKKCTHTQNDGILTRYVEAAKAEAQARHMPVADAYAKWQAMDRCGVDTTAMLANDINHPIPEMHELFVEAILDKLFE